MPHDGPIDKSFSVTAAPELTKKAAEKDDDDDEDEEEEEEEVQHPDFLAHFSTFPSVIQVRKRRATRLAGHFLGCSSSFSPLITNFDFFEYISPAGTEISLGGRRRGSAKAQRRGAACFRIPQEIGHGKSTFSHIIMHLQMGSIHCHL